MGINKYTYIIYPLAFAFCLAWAVTGWISMKASSVTFMPATSKVKKQLSKVNLPDISLIVQKNIFDAETTSETIENTSESVMSAVPVDSGFDGKLLGVLFGDETSMAVVSYKDKKTILKLDEEKDGLILEDVGYFHAIISKNGEKYKLVLKSEKDGGNAGSTTKVNTTSATTQKFKISRKVVVEELSDVNSVIKSILIVPYERDGKFEGYRVRRMTNTSVLKKVGVARNDVIMRLNGKSLETPAVFFDALKNAENLSAVSLDILRAGKKMTLYVEIEG